MECRKPRQKRLLCLFHEPVSEASEAVTKLVKQLGLACSPVIVEELLQARHEVPLDAVKEVWILNCVKPQRCPGA